MTGQRLGQAGWLSPFVPNRKEAAPEAEFTSSSGGVRAPSVTRSRNCAARSDEKPLQVESSSPGEFRSRANRSYPEGIRLLLCISTDARLWRPLAGPPNENRRKARQTERALRGGHAVWAGPVKTSRNAGDGQNATAGLQMKGNLRAKRRDPWHQANARPKAVADLALSGEDAAKEVADVS